jgi:hypothetical protein
MGWQPGEGSRTGEEPAPEPSPPGAGTPGASNARDGQAPVDGPPRTSAAAGPRDERLAGFTRDAEWDRCAPGPELAAVLAAVGGPEWRCPGAEPDELIGVLRRLAALESWASAAKLGVIRELIRRDGLRPPGRPLHGDLPDEWSDSLNHELALAQAVSVQSAEKTTLTAWELGARLPGIAALHADGTLAYSKSRLITETFQWLNDEDASKAEAMILPQLTGTPGKTYGQIMNLAARIASEVDPGLAERRRQAAVKQASRVQMFREQSGAAALSGRDLPPDETLAAYANVTARAARYKDSGAFLNARMDQLRVTAYLDLINGVTADARIAHGHLSTGAPDPGAPDPGDTEPPSGPGPGGGAPSGSGAGGHDNQSAPNPSRGRPEGRPVLADLVFPLATLLGLAERPGEGHGLGVLDPALCRDLAELAVASPHSRVCVTVTDPDGVAIGHGCGSSGKLTNAPPGPCPAAGPPPPVALPARVNLTITADRLSAVLPAASGPPGKVGLRKSAGRPLTRGSPADPEWCGTWELTLPGALELVVLIEPVPTYDCDHRHESRAYQPNDKLRHLVQVRDYTCTFPPCSRHARDSDFEHAQPYDKGGRTCSCNAGARSRKCHRVKQSPGWKVTQPKPGWHEWTTPSGRTYIQAPYRYPV